MRCWCCCLLLTLTPSYFMSSCQCQRCKQTGSGPQAFLLTCQGCSKTWHHSTSPSPQIGLSTHFVLGCHMPPVGDEELIQLIRATTRGDKDKDLSSWMCRRCKRGASGTPSAMSSREPTASSSSDSREGSRTVTTGYGPAVRHTASTASAASTADVRVKQESVCSDSQFGSLDASSECSAEYYSRCATCERPEE